MAKDHYPQPPHKLNEIGALRALDADPPSPNFRPIPTVLPPKFGNFDITFFANHYALKIFRYHFSV